MGGLDGGAIHEIEQQEDDDQHRRNDLAESPAGSDLVLEFTGVLEGHASGEGGHDFAVHSLLDFGDKGSEVSVLDVGLDKDPQASVFASDFSRSIGALDSGHQREWHRGPVGGRY